MTPRRYSPVTVLAILVVAFALFVGGATWYILERFDRIESRSSCRSALMADLFADSFDALKAPPVDPKLSEAEQAKTDRGKAVASGSATAKKLHRANEVCP